MLLTLVDRLNFSSTDSASSRSVSSDCSSIPYATLGVRDSTLDSSFNLGRFVRLPVDDDPAVDGALRFTPCTWIFDSLLMDWSDIFEGRRDMVPEKLGSWESVHNKYKTTSHFFTTKQSRKERSIHQRHVLDRWTATYGCDNTDETP